MVEDSPKVKIEKARASLVLTQPFFASLLLRLRVHPDSTCETAWVDGRELGYNPQFIEGLSFDEVKGVLCHEVLHCAMLHTFRRGNRELDNWNKACDYAINPVVLSSGMRLPASALIDWQYDGKSAEEIFGMFPKPQQSDSGKSEDSQANGQGEGESDESEGNGEGQGTPSHDPGKCGEVRDGKAEDGGTASPAELAEQESTWKVALSQAAQQAKAQGSLPAGLERLIEDILQPLVDWREVLRRFVDRSAKSDYSWVRPNRRFVADGIYLPSLQSEQLPPIVIGVDTSGSVDEVLLAQFASEVGAILDSYQTTATVVYCDSRINRIDEYSTQDLPITLQACGGGGTDFRPVFEHIDESAEPITCLIYLTDMEGDFPEAEPGYPVLWIATGSTVEAPFGEVVKLK